MSSARQRNLYGGAVGGCFQADARPSRAGRDDGLLAGRGARG